MSVEEIQVQGSAEEKKRRTWGRSCQGWNVPCGEETASLLYLLFVPSPAPIGGRQYRVYQEDVSLILIKADLQRTLEQNRERCLYKD